jgi:hypothetical protein
MEELIIYYEEETRELRARIEQQNREIVELYNQIGLRYRLYSALEEDHNNLKGEFERFKKEMLRNHVSSIEPPHASQPSEPPQPSGPTDSGADRVVRHQPHPHPREPLGV